jgi:hypothetical protein
MLQIFENREHVNKLKKYEEIIYGYDPIFPENGIRYFSAKPIPKQDKMTNVGLFKRYLHNSGWWALLIFYSL